MLKIAVGGVSRLAPCSSTSQKKRKTGYPNPALRTTVEGLLWELDDPQVRWPQKARWRRLRSLRLDQPPEESSCSRKSVDVRSRYKRTCGEVIPNKTTASCFQVTPQSNEGFLRLRQRLLGVVKEPRKYDGHCLPQVGGIVVCPTVEIVPCEASTDDEFLVDSVYVRPPRIEVIARLGSGDLLESELPIQAGLVRDDSNPIDKNAGRSDIPNSQWRKH